MKDIKKNDGHSKAVSTTRDIRQLKGIVKTNKRISLEDMKAAIRKGACQN